MTMVPSPKLILVVSLLCASACDGQEDAAASSAVPGAEASAVATPTRENAPPPATTPPRDAPAGRWSVKSHHPRVHQLDDAAWAELTLELLSGVVGTKAEPEGLRLLTLGRGSVVEQVGLLPGDLVTSLGSARPPTPASLHDAWALGERTKWVEVERQRDSSTDTLLLWIPERSKARTLASVMVWLGVARQDDGRRLIDRTLLEALAEAPWLHPYPELWRSLGVPGGGPVLRVEDTNVGPDGEEQALKLIAACADQRTFEVVVGSDEGETRLQYEIVEDLLDPEALEKIRATGAPRRSPFGGLGPKSRSAAGADDDAIEEKGELRRSIDRKRFEALLADPAVLARSARVVPNMEDGEPRGFKLYGIRRSGLLGELGFKNGDLILSVQGGAIEGLDDALKAYTELSKSPPDTIRVGITRRGAELELTFDLD